MDLILIRKACHASEIGVHESQPGFLLWILFLFLPCLPKTPSSAACMLPSEPAVQRCRGWNLTTFICSIKRWMDLLLYVLCYTKVHLSITFSGSYIKEECRGPGSECTRLPSSSDRVSISTPSAQFPAAGMWLTNAACQDRDYNLIQNSNCTLWTHAWNHAE